MHEPIMRAVIETAREEGFEKGFKKGIMIVKSQAAIALHEEGEPIEYLTKITQIPEDKVIKIIENYKN